MLLLVAKAHETILKHQHPNVGRLVGPRHYHRIAETAEFMPWAADNDAYSGFDPDKYMLMLDKIQGVPGCLFVTAPDVVGDALKTDERFYVWEPALRVRGLPIAYVGQDGATVKTVPWADMSALFIGGSTQWKLSADAHALVEEAQRRGKWVHMGRVNTWRRLKYAKSIGVDSIDGTQFSMFTDTYLPRFSQMAAAPTQGRLE